TGSLGLDLATTIDVTLLDSKPQRIPTGVKGPILINQQPQGALLLGRSSSGLRGLNVLPGVIDADYTGEIQIVVQTLFTPMFIPKRSRIAQLIPLPQLTAALHPMCKQSRGEGSFGSTGGLAMLTLALKDRPIVTATFQYQDFELRTQVLLDPGADLTIV
ncbi:POK9 protein, partial [Melanocharis versteri]|nr:POK9 protein [Melanocharis versteri]